MSLKILAVDDEPEVLKLIKSIVEPLGCEILTLGDSREAVRRLEGERFDGFFVDAQMPNIDGFELTTRIRQSPSYKDTPVIMITGQDDVVTMRKGFKAGVTCFLGKPIGWERLYNLIKAMRGPMLREKRRQARLPYRTTVKCRLPSDAGQERLWTCLVIGEGGMLLAATGAVEENLEVEMEFPMPNRPRPLKARAKVLRKEPPDRIAVEFKSISEEDLEVIRQFIAGSVTL